MSLYMRRLLARRILQTIGACDREGVSSSQKLEKDLAAVIKLAQQKKKDIVDKPQFFVNLTQAKKVFSDDTVRSLRSLNVAHLNQVAEKSSNDVLFKNVQEDKTALHITLDQSKLNEIILQMVSNQNDQYGCTEMACDVDKKTILVEYSSPNVAKPFHAGHIRSTILGNVIGNLYESVGHRVVRVNFLGDWGKQFGLVCHGYRKYGNEESLQADAMKHLFDVYVKVNEDIKKETEKHSELTSEAAQREFRNLENGEENSLSLWRKFRELSLEEYKKIYKRLNINFTDYEGESMYQKNSTAELLKKLETDNLLKMESPDGAAYVEIDPIDNDTDRVVIMRQDNTTLYITRDIAAALERSEKYQFDKIHYVVASSQERHFSLLLAVLRKMAVPWAINQDDVHVKFGLINGMSTRRGNVVFLKDILDEARDRMIESIQNKDTSRHSESEDIEKVADQLGMSALIVRDLKERRMKDYQFDWKTVQNPKSDSGVFLQYGYARLCSLMEKCHSLETDDNVDVSLLKEGEAVNLILHIAKYEDAVQSALEELEPCHIVNILLSLVHASNNALHKLNVKNQQEDIAKARLLMFKCARITLANGLTLLGITPLSKM